MEVLESPVLLKVDQVRGVEGDPLPIDFQLFLDGLYQKPDELQYLDRSVESPVAGGCVRFVKDGVDWVLAQHFGEVLLPVLEEDIEVDMSAAEHRQGFVVIFPDITAVMVGGLHPFLDLRSVGRLQDGLGVVESRFSLLGPDESQSVGEEGSV